MKTERREKTGMAQRVSVGMLLVMVLLAGTAFGEEKIRIAGSGGMISMMNELAKAYKAENRDVQIDINQKSIESTGGVQSAAAGQVEIGLVARALKDDEKTLGLETVEIYRVATVIGVHKNVTVKEITSEQLCKVYSGTVTNWKDLGGSAESVTPLTRPDRDATKDSVRKGIACFKDLKEAAAVVIVPTAPEMSKLLASRPGSIGFTDAVAVDDAQGAIISLRLDGAAPTQDNVRNGKYRIIKNNYLVTKGKPTGAVKSFLDFVSGPKGTKIIAANKAVPVK